MKAYAFAFARWLIRCHDAGFTYRNCDWRTRSVRRSWIHMNGNPPI